MKLKMTELTIMIYMTYDDVSERFCTVNSAADNFEDVLRLA